MKRFIAVIAGFLAGFLAWLVLGWLKRVKPCQEQEEAHTSLADTQPIKVNPDYIEPDFL